MAEELALCPFCGNNELVEHEGKVACVNDRCEYPPTLVKKEIWQNAWCWKRISALEAQVKELEEILETYRIEAVEKAVNEKLKARQILGEESK